MSHTKACLCSCRCFHLDTGLLLHLKKHRSHACLLDKSHESRIDWTYSSRLWKWCENAGCSTGTQAELDLGTFLRSSWKYFRNFLRLFLYTKHTSRPVLRGPRLLLFAFVRLPSSRWKSQSDQHLFWFYFELCQVGKKNPWHTMAIYGIITLIIWSARLGQICCTMMHHVASQSMPLQL